MGTDREARSALPLSAPVLEILIALGKGPAHGYAIITEVEGQTEETVTLSTSSLYAALRRMHRQGLVEDAGRLSGESGGPPRKYFRITDFGERVAKLEVLRLRRTAERAAERFLGPAAAGPGEG